MRTQSGVPGAKDISLLILINLMWGSTYVVSRGLLDSAPPMVVAFARFTVAALWMLLVGAHRERPSSLHPPPTKPLRDRTDYLLIALIGLMGFGLAKYFIYEGLSRSTATDAALIINLEPVFTAALAYGILRQHLGRVQWLGLWISFAGGVALVWPDQSTAHARARAFGNALMVASVAVEAMVSVLGARATRTYSGLQVTAYATYWGAAALLPLAWWQWQAGDFALHWLTWANGAALIYLALGPTVFAYTIWFRLLEHVDAGRAATYLYVQPLLGLALGVCIRSEWPTWNGALGAGLVLFGIWLSSRAGTRAEVPEAESR